MKRPMETQPIDSEWSLFEDPDEPASAISNEKAVGGVPANEHPYFKKRLFPDESLKDALEDYVPTACDFLMAGHAGLGTLGRTTSAKLQEAAEAFAADQLETCVQAATRCAAAAWQLLQQLPTEAALHAHALAHAMLAASIKDVNQAMAHADLSLSLCPDLPIPAVHSVMRKCNERCQNAVAIGVRDAIAWEISGVLPTCTAKTPKVRFPLRRMVSTQLSMMDFREKWLNIQQPGVIEGHLITAGWTTERWKDLRFWAERHGHRTVPVEMGFRQADEQSFALQQSDSQGSMLLSDFTKRFLLSSNTVLQQGCKSPAAEPIDEWPISEVAYMAQHQLLLQIPELRNNICVPHYCSLGELQTVNLWIGSAGTVTALHYDLDDNFLVQVAGYKYLRLYDPEEGERLYAKDAPRDRHRKHGASYSPVRVECPDSKVHPNFADAHFVETILGPGDMLFIPKRWWHYVRSLTTSISVNFWF